MSAPAPGQVLDLSRWSLTLPIARPGDPTRPRVVRWPELATFRHELFDVRGGAVEYVAAVEGVPTSANTRSTRCELRETTPGWDPRTATRTLTCTLTCDPTGAAPRRACIVGQVHAGDPRPPLTLVVEMGTRPGTLAAFVRGTTPRRHPLLSGLGPDTVLTYRIRVAGGRCLVWAAPGDLTALPPSPTAVFSLGDLGDPGPSYVKAGAYNKSPIDGGSGRSVVRHLRLDLE